MSSSPGYDESEPKQTWCQHSQGYGQVHFSHRAALRSLDKVLHLSQPWAEYTMTLLQLPSNNFIAILVCVSTVCAIHTVTKLPKQHIFLEHISTVKQCKPAYLSVTYLSVISLSTHPHIIHVCVTLPVLWSDSKTCLRLPRTMPIMYLTLYGKSKFVRLGERLWRASKAYFKKVWSPDFSCSSFRRS